jgi:hypothetical protein
LYDLLAKLKGHRNADPPVICYVPQSCCLISGEKHLSDSATSQKESSLQKAGAKKYTEQKQSGYTSSNQRAQNPCEILIWNLQKDLVELFQSRPPWNVSVARRVVAHNASIIDICYLPKAQLVVTASSDQTIKFFDPVSKAYELTDPSNNPHVARKPGHYMPLKKETTRNNITFKEVKRIYTGSDVSCYSLRSLVISGISVDPKSSMKQSIEWLVALKLGNAETQSQERSNALGIITGYGIERVKIEVPALHHDDIVPPFVIKECEEMITNRRKKVMARF